MSRGVPAETSGGTEIGLPNRQKLRGGYYTSPAVARWLCSWAIRSPRDRVLEPSCGGGVFLEAAANKLFELGARGTHVEKELIGVEIARPEATASHKRLRSLLGEHASPTVHHADFFQWLHRNREAVFDCVVGNPPFIRYQNFPDPSRSRAMWMMNTLGLRTNRLTNAWVPFVAGSVARLAPGGRLAMVLPAELLQVTYAAQLRSFLADNFKSIDIVACNDLFFDKAEQEVVLLLADERLEEPSPSNKCSVDLLEAEHVEEVLLSCPRQGADSKRRKMVRHDTEKWLKYFLSPREIAFMRRLRSCDDIVTLKHHASVDVGIVTGRNEFFVLSRTDVDHFGLQEHTVPLIGRSAQLKGAVIKRSEWNALAEEEHRVFLFYANHWANRPLSSSAKNYVRLGEERRFHTGYKCRIREPWYTVPSAWKPDCFFFRQIYDFPRVVVNRIKATSTDTIHRMQCESDPALVASNIYTHLTAASAEIEGRSYGGGVLELEPTEAESLLLPRVLTSKALPVEEADELIRLGRIHEVLRENDKRVLIDALGLSSADCAMLRRVWVKMRDRRMARRRGRKPRR